MPKPTIKIPLWPTHFYIAISPFALLTVAFIAMLICISGGLPGCTAAALLGVGVTAKSLRMSVPLEDAPISAVSNTQGKENTEVDKGKVLRRNLEIGTDTPKPSLNSEQPGLLLPTLSFDRRAR